MFMKNQGKLAVKRKALSGILLSTIVAMTLTACGSKDTSVSANSPGSPASGSDVIRIADIGPFSGDAAALGTWDNQGIMMAVDAVNAKGGIRGKKIEIVKIDDQGNPSLTVNAAQKVINDKVVAAFAAPLSTTTLAALEVFNQAKIPQISGGQSPAITTKGSQYIFRDTASSTAFTKTAADYIVNKLGTKKIAVITNSGAFGKGEHDTFVGALKSLNVTPISDQVVTPDAKEFSAQLSNIKSADPDVLYIGAEDIQSGLIVKEARSLGINAKIVGGDSLGTTTYINTAGKDNAEGTIFITLYFPDANAETKAFDADYKKKYGKESVFHVAKGYDGAEMLIEAIDKAYPNLDGVHIRDALRQLSYHGLTGDYKFNESGEGLEKAQIGIVKNGKAEPLQ